MILQHKPDVPAKDHVLHRLSSGLCAWLATQKQGAKSPGVRCWWSSKTRRFYICYVANVLVEKKLHSAVGSLTLEAL
jgi:hypothetical protein